VLIFGPEHTSAVLVAADKASSTILRTGTSIRLDQFPGTKGFVKALQDEKVSVLGDTQNADPCSSLLPALAAKGIRTILSAPLLAQGELLGFLSLGRPEPNSFSPEDTRIVREVAELLAIAAHQAQLFQDLSMNHAQARKLARQVVNAQEEERRRISRILHDETGQTLATLSISLALIERDLPADNPLLQQRVARASIMVNEIADRTRSLAQSLRPPALEHVGLNATLEAYCRAFAMQTRLAVEYRGTEPTTSSEAAKICLYRCLQEALTNIVKHAGASLVRVELRDDPVTARVYLSVQDDGRGFSLERPLSGWTWGGGSGLFGMQERLESLGGTLTITSQPGQGCLLEAFLPWTPTEA
jgi:signal transduction histidine kinase